MRPPDRPEDASCHSRDGGVGEYCETLGHRFPVVEQDARGVQGYSEDRPTGAERHHHDSPTGEEKLPRSLRSARRSSAPETIRLARTAESMWEVNIGPNRSFQTKGPPHELLPNALYSSAFASPTPTPRRGRGGAQG